MTTVKILIGFAIAGVIVYFLWKGIVKTGTPKLKSSTGASLTDPCPGLDQIWDADLERCIPFNAR